MSNKLKYAVDAIAGEYNWYIAGGAAAYWIIANYVSDNPNMVDKDYYDSILPQIFPGDVEGNSTTAVIIPTFEGKFGPLGIELQEMEDAMLREKIEIHCDQIDGINVFDAESVIARYRAAGGTPAKTAKRNLRVGLLKCVQRSVHIDAGTVGALIPKPAMSLAAQIKGFGKGLGKGE